jgi:hypothetical protein
MRIRKLGATALIMLAATLGVSVAPALAAPPETPETVSPATGITGTGATLHGVLNPGGPSEGGGYRFSYKQSATECEPEGTFRPESPALALGNEKEAVSTVLTGLEPDREYTFCVVASNLSAETATGGPVTFKTHALPPSVDAESESVGSTSVQLEAQVNPNNQATGYVFEYATEATGETLEGTIVTVPGAEPLPAQFGDATATVPRIEGLTSGKTYFYRVVAENLQSKEEVIPVEGQVKSFTTVPVPTTEEATAVTATTAMFHGHLTPLNSVDTEYAFDYRVGSECTGEGSTTPADAGTGSTPEEVSSEATGLQPSATYSVCLVSINAFGSEADPAAPAVSFTTPAAPPKVDGESTSSLTPFAVTLEAQLNANNERTTYAFEYADKESKLGTAEATVLKGEGPLEGYGDQGPAINTGIVLTPSTTYFYRVTAESAQTKIEGKPVQGAIQSFTTLPALAPIIEAGSEHATSIGSRTATFEANINPDYQETTVVFEYATTEPKLLAGEGTKVPAAPVGPAGEAQPVSELVEGLTPATTYYLRVTATNATGTTHSSPPITFTTLVVPLVEETEPEATEIGQHTALIANITVNPQFEEPVEPGEEPSYFIVYGETEAYGQALPAPTHEKAGYGLTGHKVPAIELSGLKSATTYHYAIVAHNPNGTTLSADHQFTTHAAPPFTTPPAIGNSSARFTSENSTVIEGEINAEGLQSTYEVQYGTSTAYGSSAPGPATIAPFTSAQGTIAALTGLAPGTTYHYRIVASNGAGTGYGPDATFTTTGAARTGTFTPFSVPTVPLIAATPAVFPAEGPVAAGTTPKALTRAQKLARALKACGKQAKRKRAGCKAKARKRYGQSKKR